MLLYLLQLKLPLLNSLNYLLKNLLMSHHLYSHSFSHHNHNCHNQYNLHHVPRREEMDFHLLHT